MSEGPRRNRVARERVTGIAMPTHNSLLRHTSSFASMALWVMGGGPALRKQVSEIPPVSLPSGGGADGFLSRLQSWPIVEPAIAPRLFVVTQHPQTMATRKIVLKTTNRDCRRGTMHPTERGPYSAIA